MKKMTSKSLFTMLTILLMNLTSFAQNGGDDCANAVTAMPGTFLNTTITSAGTGTGAAAWFSYVASGDGVITIDSGIDLDSPDTRVFIYDNCIDLTELDSDDDNGDAVTSTITNFAVTSGTEYIISWDDRWSIAPFDWELSFTPAAANAPDCAENFMPADGTTDVPSAGTVALSWEAPLTGPVPDSYDVFFGTDMAALVLGSNIIGLTTSVNGLVEGTTYFWQIVPKNAAGDAVGCIINSFGIAIPAGAVCDTAIVVTEGTTMGATFPISDGISDNGDSIWYSYTATGDGTINVNSCLGGADSNLVIFDECTGTALASNDDSCPFASDGTGSAYASEIANLDVIEGEDYLIQWDDRWGVSVFDWSLTFTPGPVDLFVNDDFTDADGTVIVDADPNTAGDQEGIIGTTAFSTIQAAIDVATAIDIVKITDDLDTDGAAIYTENLLVSQDITIMSTEDDVTAVIIDGNNSDVVITKNGGNLTLSGITIRDGRGVDGAGIFSMAGELNVTNCLFDLNFANVLGSDGNGGAIFVGMDADATIVDCTFTRNRALNEGGAIWNGAGSLDVINSTFTRNRAFGDDMGASGGGAIYNEGGDVTTDATTVFENNFATDGASGSGGALLIAGGTYTATGTLFRRNRANRAGGAIEVRPLEFEGPPSATITLTDVMMDLNTTGVFGTAAPGNGAGVHITGDSSITITNGNFTRNTAANEGGGLWNGSGSMIISNTSITNNIARGDDNGASGGGGIFNEGGILTTDATTSITRNNATAGASGSGGGLLIAGGLFIANGTTISNNNSNRAGGGIEVRNALSDDSPASLTLINVTLRTNITGVNTGPGAPGNGGGIHVTGTSNVTFNSGSIITNTAASEGGGLWNGTGVMTVNGASIINNRADGDASDNGGAGIFNDGGTLNINSTDVFRNKARGIAGSGGGILSTAGNVIINDSRIDGNIANRSGGAIEVIGGDLSMSNSRMHSNIAGPVGFGNQSNGGALNVTGNMSTINISDSTINDNIAANDGGGLWNQSGSTMNVTNCTIEGNTSFLFNFINGGGGILNRGILNVTSTTISNNEVDVIAIEAFSRLGGSYGGAGVFNSFGGVATIVSSTISSNETFAFGGGIGNQGTVSIIASTIAFNSAGEWDGIYNEFGSGTINLRSSIVSNNGNDDVDAGITSNGFNIIMNDPNSHFTPTVDDQVDVDPLLLPLLFSGFETRVHVVGAGSPAISGGDPSLSILDQRGLEVNGLREVGAVEKRGVLPTPPGLPGFDRTQELSEGVFSNGSLDQNILMYPNPAASIFNLDILASFGTQMDVSIIELGSGKIVGAFTAIAGNNTINVSHLTNGVYLVQVVSETNSTSKKLVINN